MIRLSWILALVGAASASFASFELVLVADQVTGGRIHRFDGENGIYLGSFGFTGGFYGTATSMVVVQSRNECWVNEGGFVHRFDYNTGSYLGMFNTGIGMTSMSVSRDGNSLYVFNNSSTIFKYSTATLTQTNSYAFGGTNAFFSGAETLAGIVIAQDTQTAGTVGYRPLNTSALTIGSGFNLAGSGRHVSAIPRINHGTTFGVAFDNLNVVGTTGDNASLQGISLTTSQYATFYAGSGILGFTSVSLSSGAHQGMYFGGTDAGGNWFISHRSPVYSQMNTFGSGYLTSPFAMATVIAPEPGSMIALGLGISALVARRRRKN